MNTRIEQLKYLLRDSYDMFCKKNFLTEEHIESMDAELYGELLDAVNDYIADSY